MNSLSLINCVIILFFLKVVKSIESVSDDKLEWDYEPRDWSLDEKHSFEEEYSTEVENYEMKSDNFDRSKINFLKPTTNLKQQPEECNQFRVDIREAVVCDKNHCDKLDFKWPEYENQLTMIQTTKHGMRFHRSDFTFEVNPKKSTKLKVKDDDCRIKFDILELFKPSTTTTTTTTAQPTTKAASSTTSSPFSPIPYPFTTTTKSPETDTSQDSNNTKLVTTFRLDTRRTKQKMIGFGGALSDSTCRNIKSLSPKMAQSLMEDYYGDRGLRYNIARLSIGSSDFSTTPYTNNDRPTNKSTSSFKFSTDEEQDDVEMNNFHLTDEDYNFKLPVARQAIATSRQELKFFSSLWSPPIWMKNNSHIVHGYLKGDVYGPYYKGLAELIIKWFEAYRKNGIEFWATTGLNEPVTGVKPFIFHNSLGMTRDDYITFFKLYLGPLMRRRGFQNVKLIMLDDNKGYAPNWVKTMLEDSEASKYVSGVAFHWYMNDEYENLNFLEKKYPEKFIIASEACNGFLPFQVHALPGDWDRGVAYMYDIIKMIQKNTAAWIDWNMALDLGGGPSWANNNLDAAIIVNSARNEYYKSPMFYAIGHFSRFVEPDSLRLDYILANARFDYPVEAVAFYTPKEYIVIVALNANKYPVPFKVIVNKQLVRIVTLRADSYNTIIFKWKKSNN